MTFVVLALAASTVFAGVGKKYGTAGCGIGSILMGKSGNQVMAATSNSTFYSQLFGITSGTSNCAEDGVAMADKEKEYFSNANFESLKQEMAQGKGENLLAMATLFGCSGETFATTMQSNYSHIFSSGEVDSEVMLEKVETIVDSDQTLRQACTEVN